MPPGLTLGILPKMRRCQGAELTALNLLDNPGRIQNDDETGFPLHSQPPKNLVGKGSSTARMGKYIEPFLRS